MTTRPPWSAAAARATTAYWMVAAHRAVRAADRRPKEVPTPEGFGWAKAMAGMAVAGSRGWGALRETFGGGDDCVWSSWGGE